MKTRREQIEEAAPEEIDGNLFRIFVVGAEWADANPDNLTYELADEMEAYRNKCEDLEHDHAAMRISLEYYASDPLGTYAQEVLSKLKVK